jgi:hypothetical protein
LRRHLYSIAILIAFAAIGLLWHLQPRRQVQRHTERFLARAESKDWNGMAELIADDYSDRWGHARTDVVDRTREVLQQFLLLRIEATDMEVSEENGTGTTRARLSLAGRGGPIAEYAVERVARLTQPFTFTWHQRSWKPWDWELTNVAQPELEIGRE